MSQASRKDSPMASDSADASVRVLVVDDQLPFRDVAHDLIDATAGFTWIGGLSCGEEAIEQVERLRPDLVLMDVRMPGIGGMRAAQEIASLGIPAVVVLVTADESQHLAGCEGAAEIVPKRHLTRALLRRLWEDHRQRARDRAAGRERPGLTARAGPG
jgi:DNA-binding NarL/FixJ family response regulator